MFEHLRQTIRDFGSGALSPGERRTELARMKSTLVQARVGLADMAQALAATRSQLGLEQRELATVRRRKALAEQIDDAETVAVAARFEERHAQRAEVLTRKLAAQEEELMLAESEVESMTKELRAASAGVGGGLSSALGDSESAILDDEATRLQQELDHLARQRRRVAAEADADERLADLKRKMEK